MDLLRVRKATLCKPSVTINNRSSNSPSPLPIQPHEQDDYPNETFRLRSADDERADGDYSRHYHLPDDGLHLGRQPEHHGRHRHGQRRHLHHHGHHLHVLHPHHGALRPPTLRPGAGHGPERLLCLHRLHQDGLRLVVRPHRRAYRGRGLYHPHRDEPPRRHRQRYPRLYPQCHRAGHRALHCFHRTEEWRCHRLQPGHVCHARNHHLRPRTALHHRPCADGHTAHPQRPRRPTARHPRHDAHRPADGPDHVWRCGWPAAVHRSDRLQV